MKLSIEATEDLAFTLFADALSSEIERRYCDPEDEKEPGDTEIWGELLNQVMRSQCDIVELCRDLLAEKKCDPSEYLQESIELVNKIDAEITKRSGGKMTLGDIYEFNRHDASGAALGAVGHGVCATDSKEFCEWAENQGIDTDIFHRLYFESPYDSASIMSDRLFEAAKKEEIQARFFACHPAD